MARLRIEGFETGVPTELFGTASLSSAIKRTGAYSLRTNPTTTGFGSFWIRETDNTGVALGASIYSRFYFRVATLPAAADECIVRYVIHIANNLELRINSSGILMLYDQSSTLFATGSASLSLDTWYQIEFKAIIGVTETYEVKVNGVVDISGTTGGSAGDSCSAVNLGKSIDRNGNTVDFYYDDISIDDAAYPGVGEIHILKPRAAGATAAWTTGTSALFSAVNEVPHDSDTTYIGSATSANASSFAMDSGATGGVIGTIAVVKTMGFFRDEGGVSSVSIRLRNGTTNRDSTAVDPGATYAILYRLDATDPNTSAAWTSAGLNTVEAGAVNSAAVAARCTALYVMVESVGPATVTRDVTSAAALSAAATSDVTSAGALSVAVASDVTSGAALSVAVTRDITSTAAASMTLTSDVTSVAALAQLPTSDVTSLAATSVPVASDVTSGASISAAVARDVTSTAALSQTVISDVTSMAATSTVVASDVTSGAAIGFSVTSDVTTAASLGFIGISDVTTVAALSIVAYADVTTVTAIGRVSNLPVPQPGSGRFYGPSSSNSARFVASKTGSGRFYGPQRGSGR